VAALTGTLYRGEATARAARAAIASCRRRSSGRSWEKAEGDREMQAFLALAGTTTMRKGELLSLRWDRIHLEDAPYATLVRIKTGHQRHVPIPQRTSASTIYGTPAQRF